MNKKLLTIIGCAILLACVLTINTGCTTTTVETPNGTNTVTVLTAQGTNLINTAAVAVKVGADAGTLVVLKKDTNARAYFTAGVTAVDTFITGADLTPSALADALSKTSTKELSNDLVQFSIDTIVSVYEVQYKQIVVNSVNQNYVATTLLKALRNGIAQALNETAPVGSTPIVLVQ